MLIIQLLHLLGRNTNNKVFVVIVGMWKIPLVNFPLSNHSDYITAASGKDHHLSSGLPV